MRSPADFVIDDGPTTTMYCHSRAAGYLGPFLIEGPDIVITEARTGERVDDFDSCGEAVVLIDVRRRILAVSGWLNMSWFEGVLTPNSAQLQFAYRAAYYALLAQAWPGWELQWAYEGIDDIVRYLGDRYRGDHKVSGRMVSEAWDIGSPEHIDPESDDVGESLLVTLAAETGSPFRAYLLANYENSALRIGVELISALPSTGLITELSCPPTSGLHLDQEARRAMVWTIRESAGLRFEWQRFWPDWQLEFRNDRYEVQLARCGDQLFILEPDMNAAWDHLSRWANPDSIAAARLQTLHTPRWPALVSPPRKNRRRSGAGRRIRGA